MTTEPAGKTDEGRRARALTAWLAGADYPDIARLLAYPDAETAKTEVAAALEQRAGQQDEELLRAGAAAMLDRLQMALWSKVQASDDVGEAAKGANIVRQIIADRRKLLGLDARAPQRQPRHLVQP